MDIADSIQNSRNCVLNSRSACGTQNDDSNTAADQVIMVSRISVSCDQNLGTMICSVMGVPWSKSIRTTQPPMYQPHCSRTARACWRVMPGNQLMDP